MYHSINWIFLPKEVRVRWPWRVEYNQNYITMIFLMHYPVTLVEFLWYVCYCCLVCSVVNVRNIWVCTCDMWLCARIFIYDIWPFCLDHIRDGMYSSIYYIYVCFIMSFLLMICVRVAILFLRMRSSTLCRRPCGARRSKDWCFIRALYLSRSTPIVCSHVPHFTVTICFYCVVSWPGFVVLLCMPLYECF